MEANSSHKLNTVPDTEQCLTNQLAGRLLNSKETGYLFSCYHQQLAGTVQRGLPDSTCKTSRHLTSPANTPRTGPKRLIHRSILRTASYYEDKYSHKILLCMRINPHALVRKQNNSTAWSKITNVQKYIFLEYLAFLEVRMLKR